MRSLRILAAAALAVGAAACTDRPIPTAAPEAPAAAEGTPVRRGWIFLPGGGPIEVGYEVVDGRALHEGDIDLGPADGIAPTREALLRRRAAACPGGEEGPSCGSVIDGRSNYTWAWGSIPFEIAGELSAAQRQTILDAIAHVEARTAGTRFVARAGQGDYIRFVPGSGCSSPVGRQGGKQEIKLAPGCFTVGIVAHEILHSLGMWHEQSRCDRDTFVTIHWGNIQNDAKHNFEKKCPHPGWFWSPAGGRDVLAYDEGSVMHYGAFAFSSNGQATITSLRGLPIGQRAGLSATDANTINLIYQPFPVQSISVSYPGNVPTISWAPYGRGATGVAVDLVVVYEEYDDYNGTSNIYDVSRDGVGFSTGTSLQDGARPYTGTERCVQYSSLYGSASYVYYYEIVATFPANVASAPVRWPAYVATC